MKKAIASSLLSLVFLYVNAQTFEFDAIQVNNLIMLGEDIRAHSYMDEKTHKEIFGDEHSVYGDTISSISYVKIDMGNYLTIKAYDRQGRILVKYEDVFKCTIFTEEVKKSNTITMMLENLEGVIYAQIDIAPYYITIDETIDGREPSAKCRQHFFLFKESHSETGKIFLAPDKSNPTYKRNKEVFLEFAKNLMTYNGRTRINELNIQFLMDHADELLRN